MSTCLATCHYDCVVGLVCTHGPRPAGFYRSLTILLCTLCQEMKMALSVENKCRSTIIIIILCWQVPQHQNKQRVPPEREDRVTGLQLPYPTRHKTRAPDSGPQLDDEARSTLSTAGLQVQMCTVTRGEVRRGERWRHHN